jgi:hypothetical protein|tara:strand:+ start:783 stop:1046 length:264 start_codon:yes stop_codon:yes gene_type:complete
MKSIVWKHHISEHFKDGTLTTDGGAGVGGTVFMDYEKMVEYLKKDGREWYVAELEVDETELEFNFKQNYMATILVNRISKTGYKPIK